ncbi:hypothetical protein DYH09_22085, partial [bacterium CPR1]|nr:hypothetical protein [bacterium CPR1]
MKARKAFGLGSARSACTAFERASGSSSFCESTRVRATSSLSPRGLKSTCTSAWEERGGKRRGQLAARRLGLLQQFPQDPLLGVGFGLDGRQGQLGV